MKKLFLVCLAMVMAISLSGCFVILFLDRNSTAIIVPEKSDGVVKALVKVYGKTLEQKDKLNVLDDIIKPVKKSELTKPVEPIEPVSDNNLTRVTAECVGWTQGSAKMQTYIFPLGKLMKEYPAKFTLVIPGLGSWKVDNNGERWENSLVVVRDTENADRMAVIIRQKGFTEEICYIEYKQEN